MDRLYFYKDDRGTLKRYYYCTFCGTGPFKEEQVTRDFFFRGFGSQPTITCRNCDIIKFPLLERTFLTQAKSIKIPVIKKASCQEYTVSVGQIWKDKDKRRNRTITISRVDPDYAYYLGGKNGRTEKAITVHRLKSRFILL